MSNQKFTRGQRVKVADDLGPYMKHLTSGVEAIIVGSYKDKYPHWGDEREEKIYTLLLLCEHPHTVSWYEEHQLTLISDNISDGIALIKLYKNS